MKHKIKLYGTSVTELYSTMESIKNSLIESIEKSPKEISIYRLEFINKVLKKLFNKFDNFEGTKIALNLSYPEILIVRYCLLHKRISANMNDLYMKIDSKIHPSIFERN